MITEKTPLELQLANLLVDNTSCCGEEADKVIPMIFSLLDSNKHEPRVIKKNADGLNECPYCGGLEFKIESRSSCGGHGDFGTISHLKCLTCKAKTTFENYYDQFDREKYNKRC